MFLIIMILSLPVSGQVDVNDFNTNLEIGLAAPQFDAWFGHFDILPELVVVAPRNGENGSSQAFFILDTVDVFAERYVPAADYQHGQTDYGNIAPDFVRYAIYVIITVIAASMIAIIPYRVGKSSVCSRPQTVPLQQPVLRKSSRGRGTQDRART